MNTGTETAYMETGMDEAIPLLEDDRMMAKA